METESEGEGAMVQSKSTKDGKISAQSSQIKISIQSWTRLWLRIPKLGNSKSNLFAEGIYKCLTSCTVGGHLVQPGEMAKADHFSVGQH